jgi:hypothetical protein
MTLSIKAHFDGKVIVPDEAVDLPVNQPLEVQLTAVHDSSRMNSIQNRLQALDRFASLATKGATIPPEALRRENMYDDR